MVEQITFYMDKATGSPYAHRVWMALEEAKVKYTTGLIDLDNKQPWFAEKVNPIGKIPAITYGGPEVPADEPSPESAKIAESLVIVEFIGELYPDAALLPKDLVKRAKARQFITVTTTMVVPFAMFLRTGNNAESAIGELEKIQNMIVCPHAIGEEFSIADVALAPLIARFKIVIHKAYGGFATEKGAEFRDELLSERFGKLWKYLDTVTSRESWKKTYVEEKVAHRMAENFAGIKLK